MARWTSDKCRVESLDLNFNALYRYWCSKHKCYLTPTFANRLSYYLAFVAWICPSIPKTKTPLHHKGPNALCLATSSHWSFRQSHIAAWIWNHLARVGISLITASLPSHSHAQRPSMMKNNRRKGWEDLSPVFYPTKGLELTITINIEPNQVAPGNSTQFALV